MTRLTRAFDDLRKRNGSALIPFLTAGDPDLATTAALITECEKRGADLLEIGVPFSDPLADGVTIQRASERALFAGTTLRRVLDLVRVVRRSSSLPLVLMGYYNPFLRMGVKALVEEAVSAGVDGLIVPDLPPEEAGDLHEYCQAGGLALIFLLAPTSTPERIRMVAEVSRGYIYYVSVRGVTGMRTSVARDLAPALARIRQYTATPLAVGFGISTPDHVREVSQVAEGVIVGSAIVDRIEKNIRHPDLVSRVGVYVAELAEAAHAARLTDDSLASSSPHRLRRPRDETL